VWRSAGTSAAAKARRNTEDAEIVIYEKDSYISYSGCGMPYFLGGEVNDGKELTPRDPLFFKTKYNVDIFIGHEVLSIDKEKKTLEVKNLETGKVFTDTYDKLIIATGARSVIPPIKGKEKEHVFSLRNIGDMYKIKKFIDEKNPKKAVIVGTGFIGLELTENFKNIGIDVTLVEMLPQVTPGLDSDMAIYVEKALEKNGVLVITGNSANEIEDDKVILADKREVEADIVIIATGVRPNVDLAVEAGIKIGTLGAIAVNTKMETSEKDIYAAGDCIEQFHLVTGKPVYRPLGSTANKTGRIAGNNAAGGELEFRGILGTGIFKVFNLTVAQTGLTEKEALKEGYDISVSHNIKPNKPEYFGGKEMVIKSIADKKDGRLLGVEIVGEEGVDKRIDVFATLITFGAKVSDLVHLDLAYAPPFSTTKDPVMYTGMIQDNAINGGRPLITPDKLDELIGSGVKYNLIDTRVKKQYDEKHIETAENKPHEVVRNEIEDLDKEAITITYCNKGTTGNAVQNILLNKGFKKVYNISGGHKTFIKYVENKKKETGRKE
jgi:NADPH-dependent 2,4-dienoyl-CoA reductase/sulfur reductase-like enzyme/rhodanese-related sulfurtransferase